MHLSIIIPVYNTSKYIIECLNSIKNQCNEHVEVVIVDDKSKDESELLIREWIKDNRHINIKLLSHFENRGLSYTRNTGINNSKGRYIWFVDSDDIICNTAINKLMSLISENEYDLIKFGMELFYPNGKKIYRVQDNAILTEKKSIFEYYLNNKIRSTVCDAIYKREVVNRVMFENDRLHEDHFYTPKVLSLSKKVLITSNILYKYRRERKNSIMSTWSEKRLDVIDATLELRKILMKEKLYKNNKKQYYKRLMKYVYMCNKWSGIRNLYNTNRIIIKKIIYAYNK